MLRHSYDNSKINGTILQRRTYVRLAINLTIILAQILRSFVNRVPGFQHIPKSNFVLEILHYEI